jgi:adenosine deaminase
MTSLKALPKISLHDHLDGGLRPQTIVDLAGEIKGLELPTRDAKALGRWFVDSANSGNLVDYLKTFDVTCAVMQSKKNLARVAHEFVVDLAADGVIYGEIRWAPEQHLREGLSLDEVVEAVQDGLDSGAAAVAKAGGSIRTGQILDAMRHTNRSLEIAELAVRHRHNGVVGFDIAGPELGFPPVNHKLAFDYLAAELMPVTVHAGEADGIDSIRDAVVSGRALRIGHGARLIEDIMSSREPQGETYFVEFGPVAEWIHDRGIALELCVSSNMQTGVLEDLGLENDVTEHPFAALYDLGFNVTVSPDNRLMSNTSITKELELLVDEFGYDLSDLQQFQINAAEASFQAADDRDELVEQILHGFAQFKK